MPFTSSNNSSPRQASSPRRTCRHLNELTRIKDIMYAIGYRCFCGEGALDATCPFHYSRNYSAPVSLVAERLLRVGQPFYASQRLHPTHISPGEVTMGTGIGTTINADNLQENINRARQALRDNEPF